MSVSVKKMDGVESVNVSLNDGLATIMFSPENRVSIPAIRRAIRNNGFTPKGAEISMSGMVERDGVTLFLRLPNQDRFRLEEHPAASGSLGGVRNDLLNMEI